LPLYISARKFIKKQEMINCILSSMYMALIIKLADREMQEQIDQKIITGIIRDEY
jgi:hypothetical protein